MHQQPPKTPLFASTSPANASQLASSRVLIVYPDPTSAERSPPGSGACGEPLLGVRGGVAQRVADVAAVVGLPQRLGPAQRDLAVVRRRGDKDGGVVVEQSPRHG